MTLSVVEARLNHMYAVTNLYVTFGWHNLQKLVRVSNFDMHVSFSSNFVELSDEIDQNGHLSPLMPSKKLAAGSWTRQ